MRKEEIAVLLLLGWIAPFAFVKAMLDANDQYNKRMQREKARYKRMDSKNK